MAFFVFYLIFVNVLSFLLFGADKSRAVNRERRIPERTLLFTALIGGSLGAEGQRLVILVPLALHAAVVLVLILLKDLLHPLEGAGGLLRVADKVALAVMQLVVILQTVRHHLLRNT